MNPFEFFKTIFYVVSTIKSSEILKQNNEILYPFGISYGNTACEKIDDYAFDVRLNYNIEIFDDQYSALFISTNGLISFKTKIPYIVPEFPMFNFDAPIFSAFWSDINISKGGNIFYGKVIDNHILNTISSDIRKTDTSHANYDSIFAFIVTWDKVANFHSNINETMKRNTFQIVITSNNTHTFIIYNYSALNWAFSAQASYYSGDDQRNWFILPGSFSEEVMELTNLSNCNTPGRWIFRIDTNARLPAFETTTQPKTSEELNAGLSTKKNLVAKKNSSMEKLTANKRKINIDEINVKYFQEKNKIAKSSVFINQIKKKSMVKLKYV